MTYTDLPLKPIAQTLIENGYEPIPCVGKRPPADGWREGAITLERFNFERALFPAAESIGLRTGRLSVFDVDFTNADHAAELRAGIESVLGKTPLTRWGKKGMAMLYRAAAPMPKLIISSPLQPKQRVEILGAGQQIIAFGRHPDTGQHYGWGREEWDGSPDPLEMPLASLPVVSADKIEAAAKAISETMERLGYGQGKYRLADPNAGTALKAPDGRPLTAAILRDMLRHVPPPAARDEWLPLVMAIRACPGPELHELSEIAVEWSAGRLDGKDEKPPLGYTTDADVLQAFYTVPPRERGVTIATLIGAAVKAGYVGSIDATPASVAFADAIEHLTGEAVTEATPAGAAHGSRREQLFERYGIKSEPQMYARTKREMLLDGLVFRRGVGGISGESGDFKSFLVQHLLMCVASGLPFFGQAPQVTGRPVFYVAAEGLEGMQGERRIAWRLRHEIATNRDVPVYMMRAPMIVNLDDEKAFFDALDLLSAEAGKPALIVVETLHKLAAGLDVDGSGMARVVAFLEHLANRFDCFAFIVHHRSDKNGAALYMNSAQYRNGLDVMWIVERHKASDFAKFTIDKLKDGEDGGEHHFKAEVFPYQGYEYTDAGGRVFPVLAGSTRVVRPLSLAEYLKGIRHGEVTAEDPYEPAKVFAVLTALGANDLETAASATVLAEELTPRLIDEDVDARKARIEKATRALRRRATEGDKPLEKYTLKNDKGERVWCLPS